MTENNLKKLREPFADNQISQLPKPTIALEKWKELPKAKCKECGAYHATTNTIHLSYVGHAALTDRLLDVDPLWNWEPLSLSPDGYPLIDKDGGMWIKLTVCGITRLGYGDSQGKTGCNATKERIGDALRNAAMRFGAALELWHKGELHSENGEKEEKEKSEFPEFATYHDYPDFIPPEPPQKETSPEDSLVEGIVEKITTSFGEKNGKKWSRYKIIMVGGEVYNTFDKKIAEDAKAAKEVGYKVEIYYQTTEKYGNAITSLSVDSKQGQAD